MGQSLVPPASTDLAVFSRPQRLTVRQRRRWFEILTSLDARNTYVVYDELGNPVFNVDEQGRGFGQFLKRVLLGAWRPFTAKVENVAGQGDVLALRRPFRFMFHRLEVRDPSGNLVGAIQKRWALLRRKYTVEGPDGREVASLFGPLLRPWTFEIRMPGSDVEIGVVQKKWSGLLTEAFTEADNFWVAFEAVPDPRLRALLFAATVLIDIVHFERSG